MTLNKTLFKTALLIGTCGYLSACASTTPGHDARMSKIDQVMTQAADNARTQGHSNQSLAMLEELYKRKSNAGNAVKYARALRGEGYYNRAAMVLGPFALDQDEDDANIIIEFAQIQAAMGDYSKAEGNARRAVTLMPESADAYHVLGIALDAQGHHEQAQVSFEKGLEHWEGDPSPILNNIGLNLAALGFLDEAIETLRKALDTAPDRTEIERNLRIVTALQYQPPKTGSRLIPKPPRKPSDDEHAAIPVDDQTVASAKVTDVNATPLNDE